MTTLYTSNDAATGFDATTAGNTPTSFANVSPAVYVIGTSSLINGHTHSASDTHAANNEWGVISGISAVADMDLLLSFANPGSGNSQSPIVRADSNFNNGYLFAISPSSATAGTVTWFSRISGGFNFINSQGYSGLTSGQPIMARAQSLGTTLRFKIWSIDQQEPAAWAVSFTDVNVTAAGFAAFYNAGVGAPFSDVAVSSLTAASVTVDTPSSKTASASFTMTGTYQTTAPLAMDYAYDGGGSFAALTSFATVAGAGNGTWSGTATAPSSNGLHWITARDHTLTTITSASAAFNVTGASSARVPGRILFNRFLSPGFPS